MTRSLAQKITDSLLSNTAYHVTTTSSAHSAQQNGIMPHVPEDSPNDPEAVYLFPDMESVDNALMNWLGDRFAEDEPLSVLAIDTTGLRIVPGGANYELISYDPVPPENILRSEPV